MELYNINIQYTSLPLFPKMDSFDSLFGEKTEFAEEMEA